MNGNNETNVGMSRQSGLSFYDSNNQPVKINKLSKPIDIYINRDPDLNSSVNMTFGLVNTDVIINNRQPQDGNQMLTFPFNLTGANNSLHFQLRPASLNFTWGYLTFLKFGSTPFYNATNRSFDMFKLFCPSGKPTFIFDSNLSQ